MKAGWIAPVDDEHRAGLRGESRFRPVGEESSRLEDAGPAVADVENAVRLFVEVRYPPGRAGERRGIGSRQFPAILDIEPDRPEIVLVHAAVHGKSQRLALGFEVCGERREGPVRLAIAAAPVDAHVVLSQIEAASDVGRAIERLIPARLGASRSRHRETK